MRTRTQYEHARAALKGTGISLQASQEHAAQFLVAFARVGPSGSSITKLSRSTFMRIPRSALLASILSLALAASASAQEQDLASLDLATLMSMDVTVTSAAKREQASADAAAAVYVITREDIRRSGATSLPEVLRLAPGVQVARLDSRSWAVTTRGFNSRFANKLLVMIDGRSIYTPVFSGVLWEEQAVVLDQIERIEVVRGPGGALWGINAVNGVINIITRDAAQSRGLQAHAGTGSIEDQSASLSYGGHAAGLGDYRLYTAHQELDSLETNGAPLSRTQVGLRLDREIRDGSLTLQGDYSHMDLGEVGEFPPVVLPVDVHSGNVAMRWNQQLAPGELALSSYYSWIDRGSPGHLDESAVGFDMQFNAERIGRHVFTGGVGYRSTLDELKSDDWFSLELTPRRSRQHQWGLYAQDEVHFFADQVRVILGAKLEDLEFTGLAFQPTGRVIWQANERHTVWTAASRAVRTPSRIELHSTTTFGAYVPEGLMLVRVFGNEDLKAENLDAYELGWRWRPHRSLSFDVALYRNEYQHLIESIPLPLQFEPGAPLTIIAPRVFENFDGTLAVEGLEAAAEWAATAWLRLEAQGTWQDSEVTGPMPGSIDPGRMLSLRARVDLPRDVELDLGWRSVSELAALGIPSYESMNARVAWWPASSIEISLAVDNLFDDEHIEFRDDLKLAPGATIGRTVFARFTWQPRR